MVDREGASVGVPAQEQAQTTTIRPDQAPYAGAITLIQRLTGALSAINILRDLVDLQLFGRLEQWVSAYHFLVQRLISLAFGWIHWRWLNVSGGEGHLLVAMAEARATVSHEQHHGLTTSRYESYLTSLATSIVYRIYPQLLLAIFLPDPFGLLVGAAFMAICAFDSLFFDVGPEWRLFFPTARQVRAEFIAVLVIVAVIVALNFAVFRPS